MDENKKPAIVNKKLSALHERATQFAEAFAGAATGEDHPKPMDNLTSVGLLVVNVVGLVWLQRGVPDAEGAAGVLGFVLSVLLLAGLLGLGHITYKRNRFLWQLKALAKEAAAVVAALEEQAIGIGEHEHAKAEEMQADYGEKLAGLEARMLRVLGVKVQRGDA